MKFCEPLKALATCHLPLAACNLPRALPNPKSVQIREHKYKNKKYMCKENWNQGKSRGKQEGTTVWGSSQRKYPKQCAILYLMCAYSFYFLPI